MNKIKSYKGRFYSINDYFGVLHNEGVISKKRRNELTRKIVDVACKKILEDCCKDSCSVSCVVLSPHGVMADKLTFETKVIPSLTHHERQMIKHKSELSTLTNYLSMLSFAIPSLGTQEFIASYHFQEMKT